MNTVTLARLRETHPDLDERFTADPALQHAVAAVTHASSFLTRLIVAESTAMDVLANLDRRTTEAAGSTVELVIWKRLELLRIAARDLVGVDGLETVGRNLALLAQDVLDAALRLAGAQDEIAIIGMGKLGGNELNYASDIDIMFVGDGGYGRDDKARRIMEIARECFRVDAALRPEGRDGPLVRSLESYQRYWQQFAQTWEFQALLKARALAGPPELTSSWTTAAVDALWSHPFGADQLRELRDMKARVEAIMSKKGWTEREVKRGRGGIRDIEFAVQLLQLVHGGVDEHIRSANTLTALEQLNEGGYVYAGDATDLADSYRFLRTLEHRLQLVEEQQTHLLPSSSSERAHIANTMGFDDLETFDDQVRSCQTTVRYAHEKLYFRPLLEAFADEGIEAGSALETQLSAFGFRDAERTRTAVRELTHGLARSSRLMQQLMPLLLDWLSRSPDPDEALLGLRKLISGFRTPNQIINSFRDSPETARRLCLLLGTSRLFTRGVTTYPELLDELANDAALVPSTSFAERIRATYQWREDNEERIRALRRGARTERIRIATADVLGLISDTEASRRRSALADAVLELTVEILAPSVAVAVIAMGRYGGSELGYGSDLDLVVVHSGTTVEQQASAEKFAQTLRRILSEPAHLLYDIDYDLRPEGRQGVLARSIDGCRDYYENWASTWERQAMLRARLVTGDTEVSDDFFSIIDPFVWEGGVSAEDLRTVRHLKARMERERLPRGGDPEFNLKLGRGSLSDVEWTVQVLQLQHQIRATNTLDALHELIKHDLIDIGDARALDDAWRFCDSARNRLYLIEDAQSDALPSNLHTLAVLARSLEIAELRDRYKQATRRCRAVTERLFYGMNP